MLAQMSPEGAAHVGLLRRDPKSLSFRTKQLTRILQQLRADDDDQQLQRQEVLARGGAPEVELPQEIFSSTESWKSSAQEIFKRRARGRGAQPVSGKSVLALAGLLPPP